MSSSSSSSSPPADTTAAFVTALVTDLIIFGAVATAFIYLRSQRKYDWLYKSRLQPDARKLNQAKPLNLDNRNVNSNSRFGWIPHVLNVSDDILLQTAGMDALLYQYFFLLVTLILGVFMILAIGIILPVNVTGEMAGVITGLDQLSMATIQNNSPRFAAHVVCFCVLASMVMFLLYRMYIHFLGLRRNYLKTAQLKGNELTLMLRDLPSELCDAETFEKFARDVFGDTVKNIYMPVDLNDLHDKLEKRRNACDKLEHYIAKVERDKQEGKKQKTYSQIKWTWKFWKIVRVDAVQYWENKLKGYNADVNELLNDAKSKQPGDMKVGFITLYSSVAYSRALTDEYVKYLPDTNSAESMDRSDKKAWKTMMADKYTLHYEHAPMPEDIYYPALKFGKQQRRMRHILITIALWAMVFFYTIPIAAASALSTLPNLEKLAPPISIVIEVSPVVKGLIAGFLPSLALLLFQALLPSILLFMSKQEGYTSYSRLERAVFQKFYIFQFVNFYLITIFAGLLLNVIKQVIDQPSTIPQLFGESIPLVATQFLNYILINIFTKLPLLLLMPAALALGTYFKSAALTKRDIQKAKQPQLVQYGTTYPLHLLVFIICMGYSVIQPLMTVFGFLYFAMGYFVVRYQLLYSSTAKYETGGLYFPMVFNRMMAALILAELTLIGLLGVKECAAAAVIMVVPFVATIVYTYYVNTRLGSQVAVLSHQNAQIVDIRLQYEQQYNAEMGAPSKSDSRFNPYIQCELDAPVVCVPFKNQQDWGLEHDVVQNLGDVGRGDIKTQVAERGDQFAEREHDIHKINEDDSKYGQGPMQNNNTGTTPTKNDNGFRYNENTTNDNSMNEQQEAHLYTPTNFDRSTVVPDNTSADQQRSNGDMFKNLYGNSRDGGNNGRSGNNDNQDDDNHDEQGNAFERAPARSNSRQYMQNVNLGQETDNNKALQRENIFPSGRLVDMFATPHYSGRQLDDRNTPISNTEQKIMTKVGATY